MRFSNSYHYTLLDDQGPIKINMDSGKFTYWSEITEVIKGLTDAADNCTTK
jgi:hypothetical protein